MTLALASIILAGMASHAMAQTTVASTFDFTPTVDCTMTVVSMTGAPLPPAGWKPTWTFTKHTRTETVVEPVDCAGCRSLVTATLLVDFYYPDINSHPTTVVTVAEPTTVVDFQCGLRRNLLAPLAGLGLPTGSPQIRNAVAEDEEAEGANLPERPPIFGEPPIPIFEGPVDSQDPAVEASDTDINQSSSSEELAEEPNPAPGPGSGLAERFLGEIGMPAIPIVKRGRKRSLCTKVLLQLPEYTVGPTKTEWTETETFTESVDCSGCPNLVHSFLPLGVPPAAIFTTTTTADTASTTTVFACSASALALPEETSVGSPEPTELAEITEP